MKPYLSVVMGIGGSVDETLWARLCAGVVRIISLAEEYCVPTEIVLVIWNSAKLHFKPECMSLSCPVRVIQTGDLHSKVPNPHSLRYFEWYPKNIGIRRALGEFVLSTNPDDLWSEDLAAFFARRELQHGKFYRANRHDTRDGKVYRVCYQTGCYPPDASPEEIVNPQPGATAWGGPHMNAAGDFMLMGREEWFKIRGNPEKTYNHTIDGETVALAMLAGFEQVILPYRIFHPDHARTLNYGADGKFAGPIDWDDANPTATMNGVDWGFAGMEFEETVL